MKITTVMIANASEELRLLTFSLAVCSVVPQYFDMHLGWQQVFLQRGNPAHAPPALRCTALLPRCLATLMVTIG